MGGYVSTTGKILGASVLAWIGAKAYCKYTAGHTPHTPSKLDGMTDEVHNRLLEAAWTGDKKTFVEALHRAGAPDDFSLVQNLWTHYRGAD